MDLYNSMAKLAAEWFFKTDKLCKAFTFHSIFLGLCPPDALAMYSLITYWVVWCEMRHFCHPERVNGSKRGAASRQ